LLEARLAQTRLLLSSELMKPIEQLPVQTSLSRALIQLLKNNGKVTPLARRLTSLAEAYSRIADWLRTQALLDRSKLERDILNGTILSTALASQVGLLDSINDGVITSEDIAEILMNAVVTSGPSHSEGDVAKLLLSMVQVSVAGVPMTDLTFEENFESIIEIAILIRLLELGRGIIATNAKASNEVPDMARTNQLRLTNIRDIGAAIASIWLIVSHDLLQHAYRWAIHPIMKSVTRSKLADALKAAIEEQASRKMEIPTHPLWPEFGRDDLFDMRLTSPWPPKPDDPTFDLSIPSPEWGNPLISDLKIDAEISDAMANALVDTIWIIQDHTERAAYAYDRVREGVTPSLNLIPADIKEDEYQGGMATIPRSTTSLPIVCMELPRPVWYDDTNNFRLLNGDENDHGGRLRSWDRHTFARVMRIIQRQPDVHFIPVLVEGGGISPVTQGLPQIVPYFDIFDAPHPAIPINKSYLLSLLDMTDDIMEDYVSQLTGNVASALARSLAESFRFIGQVVVRERGSNELGEALIPYDQMWYQTRNVASFCDFSLDDKGNPRTGIILGERENAKIDGRSTTIEFILFPFTHVPSSVLIHDMHKHLVLLDRVHRRIGYGNRPIVEWEDTSSDITPLTKIIGWKRHPSQVDYIILVRTLGDVKEQMRYVELTTAQNILGVRYFNAIVKINEATPNSDIGTATTPPPRVLKTVIDSWDSGE
jgi:hypothetical protein